MSLHGVRPLNYETTSHKFVIVLNRTHAPETLLNACAHISLGLGASLPDKVAGLPYPAPMLGITSTISAYPVIVLEAKSSTQLINLLARIRETPKLVCNLFATSMLGSSAADQIARTEKLTTDTANLIAVGVFGTRAAVGAATKKFSLYKERATNEAEVEQ